MKKSLARVAAVVLFSAAVALPTAGTAQALSPSSAPYGGHHGGSSWYDDGEVENDAWGLFLGLAQFGGRS